MSRELGQLNHEILAVDDIHERPQFWRRLTDGTTCRDASKRACRVREVRNWHEAEVPKRRLDVCFRGQSGKHMLTLSSSQFDPSETSARTHVADAKEVPP